MFFEENKANRRPRKAPTTSKKQAWWLALYEYIAAQKKDAVGSSETSVKFYPTAHRHIPGDVMFLQATSKAFKMSRVISCKN
jgi:hypothetical protein